MRDQAPSLDPIMQLGLGFWASKTLLSAIELNVFTELAKSGSVEGRELAKRLGLHDRSARDFFDTLVALGMLTRTGGGATGHAGAWGSYANTPNTAYFLDRAKPSYAGGILEMANARLYPFWGSLTQGLKTGRAQNEATKGSDFFGELYSDPARLRLFLSGMTGLSMASATAIARQFPWRDHKAFIDIGAAQGAVPVQVAQAHPHLAGGNFDLPAVGPIFNDYVKSFGLEKRLKFHPGDFFKDPLPPADVYIMGHILHDWNMEEKRALIAKCHAALPDGGALIVYEALIDDDRRQNAFGLMMSLNMLIETPGGFDFTGADGAGWMREAGFRETRVEHLAGPDSMIVGIK